jgi:NADP-dependent 3-hydroxy acid dehydrogenase YdfG
VLSFSESKLVSNESNIVTGCSSGLGASFAKHIVSSGHSLVATARTISTLSYLPDDPKILKVELDVTSIPSIKKAFAAAIKKFGHVDIVINNAGYGLMGDTEGATDEIARKQLDTNFWGVVDVRVFRDVNPVGSGGLAVQVTSLGGWVGVASGAFYHARLEP